MKFETLRYGEIQVQPEDIYTFPEGLLGFPNCVHYTFVNEEGISPFKILQSLDSSSLAFAVIDPLVVKPKYHFQLTKEDISIIHAADVDTISVYCIVNLARNIKDATINLQGPLVINKLNRLGHQFVLFDDEYSVNEKLLSAEMLQRSVPEILKNAKSTAESSEKNKVG